MNLYNIYIYIYTKYGMHGDVETSCSYLVYFLLMWYIYYFNGDIWVINY